MRDNRFMWTIWLPAVSTVAVVVWFFAYDTEDANIGGGLLVWLCLIWLVVALVTTRDKTDTED